VLFRSLAFFAQPAEEGEARFGSEFRGEPQTLERDVSVEGELDPLVDDAEAALAEHAFDAVLAVNDGSNQAKDVFTCHLFAVYSEQAGMERLI